MERRLFLHIILLLWILSFVGGKRFTIRVSSNGENKPECKSRNLPTESRPPCLSIDYVFDGGKGVSNNTDIVIDEGSYKLTNDTQFLNLFNFTIVGNKQNETKILCNPEVGISFVRCKNLLISGLKFYSCGRARNGTAQGHLVRSGIHFVFTKGIEMSFSDVDNSSGTGITMFDVGGIVNFNSVNLLRNVYNGSGGGMFFAATTCGALDIVNCTSRREQQEYIHNASFTFTSVTFAKNSHSLDEKEALDENYNSKSKFGRGGALTIHLNSNASANSFMLQYCKFKDNIANWGGAIYIGTKETCHGNSVKIIQGSFWQNKAKYAGGGIQISLLHQHDSLELNENSFDIMNTYFGVNSAIWGGAVSIRASTKIRGTQIEALKVIKFTNCQLYFNKATVGSALGLATNNLNSNPVGPGVPYHIKLDNCFIAMNEISKSEDEKVVGQGAIYAEEFVVHLKKVDFRSNTGTALILDSSTVTIAGKVRFEFNMGIKGGAIGMYGNSWICLTNKSNLTFFGNKATLKGGAIYVKSSGPSRLGFRTTKLSTAKCFLRYNDQHDFDPSKWNCKINFINNSAPDATGNSIFANTLQMCRLGGEPRMNNTALEWPNVISYVSANNRSPEIATEAIQINDSIPQWHSAPSVPFTPKLILWDEKGHSVFGTIKINITSENVSRKVHLDPPNNVFLLKDDIPDIRLVGKENSQFNLSFMTTNGQYVETAGSKQRLGYCPPGYKQGSNANDCECMISENSITRCENHTAFLLRGYWGGFDNSHSFYLVKCPKHYCKCSKTTKNPFECPFPAVQCSENREGVVCGKCKPGTSVLLGNEKCDDCSNLYLLLLIPMILVASIFVLVVVYFNFDAFSGYLNAFLYSYQSLEMMLPETVTLDPFIGFVIGVLCLSGTGNTFGVCFFDGFNDLQKLAFNLLIPVYILVFTVVVGMCLPQALWGKLFGGNVRSNSFGRALSFVYTYCYTALTSKALALLHPVRINGKLKLYSAAEVDFFGTPHVYYAIIALLVLIVFGIGFPVILLFTPFFTERFSIFSRMEPAFNTLKLCFKNPLNSRKSSNYGPFAAFYFLCRLFLLLFGIFVAEETPRLILIAFSSVMFQVIFTWFQPYIIWTMNFWDTLLLTNMCLISLVSIILSVPYVLPGLYRTLLTILLQGLVYVPLATVLLRAITYIQQKSAKMKRKNTDTSEGKATDVVLYGAHVLSIW